MVLIIPNTGIANHILGGDVFYEHISGKKYKVKIRIFRDCNECSFGGFGGGSSNDTCADLESISIYNKNNGVLLSSISVTRESYKDITPVCNAITSSCGSNPGINYGIEEHWFYSIVDFTSFSGVCNFEIGVKMSSRSTDINENNEAQHYYNNAILNVCKVPNNNSAKINASPLQIVYLNELVKYNIEASDKDGDSMSYKLMKAKISIDKFIEYPSTMSDKKPLTVKPPGVIFDNKVGELSFTPFKLGESGVFVIEITEHRKINGVMQVVGVVRSDVQFYVANSPGNSPPGLLNDEMDFEICAGDEICIDFSATDVKTGQNYDTVNFTCFSEVKGFDFLINNLKNEPYKSSSFCWKTNSFDAKPTPYYFTLKLEDNGCPIRKTSYHTFSILVKENVSASTVIKNIGCGELKLDALTKAGGNYSSYWQVIDSNNKDIKFFYEKDTSWQSLKNGQYYLWFVNQNDDNGCNVGILDTVVIDNISDLSLNLGKDLVLCEQEAFKVIPEISGAKGEVSYNWHDKSSKENFSTTLDTAIRVELLITDENLCSESDAKLITPFDKLNVSIPDQEVCYTDESINLTELFKEKAQTMDYLFFAQGPDNISIDENEGDWLLNLSKYPAKEYEIFLSYKDLNECSFMDTFKVIVTDPPSTDYSEIRTLCSNERSILLDRETNNKLPGTWIFPFDRLLIDGLNNLDISTLKDNITHIVYFSTNIMGCKVDKSFRFSVQRIPDVSITNPILEKVCVSGDSLLCESNVSNGFWNGNGLRNGYFIPSLSTRENTTISYFYTDVATGCSNSDSIKIRIFKEPQFSFGKNKDSICEFGQLPLGYNAYNQNKIEIRSFPSLSLPISSNEIQLNHSAFSDVFDLKLIGRAESEVCESSLDTFNLKINALPKGDLIPDILVGCEPLNLQFDLQNSNYELEDLDTRLVGAGVSGNSLNVSDLKKGSYDYSLYASFAGCSDTFIYDGIKVNSTPVASFLVNPELIYADDPIVYYSNTSSCEDGFNSFWQFEGKVDSNAYREDIIIKYPRIPNLFNTSLTIKTPFGCEDNFSQYIQILPSRDLHIPTAFTPNGKGPERNERFNVVSTVSGNYKIIILNRWGEQIFTSGDIENSWDGTYNGKPCKPGAYAYKIRVDRSDGYRKEYNGTVILLRAGE